MPVPPRPKALNDLLGNPGKRNRGPEPDPKKGAPEPPEWLSAEAAEEWHRVVPILAEIGMLSVVDRAALVIYAEAWSDYVRAERILRANGSDMMEGTRRTMVRHPSALTKKEAIATLKSSCAEFGLTPSARARMTLPGADPTMDLERLLS